MVHVQEPKYPVFSEGGVCNPRGLVVKLESFEALDNFWKRVAAQDMYVEPF
jgi:hypothetical protein